MNKKGAEWPTFLISSIFTMLLFLIGVFMIVDLVTTQDTKLRFDTDFFTFGMLSTRMLNSADCLAWEEPAPNNKIVHAGIINASKGKAELDKCLSGKDYLVDVYDLQGNSIKSIQSQKMSLTSAKMPQLSGKNLDPLCFDWFAVKYLKDSAINDGVAIIAINVDTDKCT